MTPELKETIELIVSGLSLLITVVMITCLWVLTKRNLKLRRTIKAKNERIEAYTELISRDWEAIKKLSEQVNQYKFVMRISDDISAEMQREIDTLKAKLNHKKRPANGNS